MTTADYDAVIQDSIFMRGDEDTPLAVVCVSSDTLDGRFKRLTIGADGIFLTDEDGARYLLEGAEVEAGMVIFEGAQLAFCQEQLRDSQDEVTYHVDVEFAPELVPSGMTP